MQRLRLKSALLSLVLVALIGVAAYIVTGALDLGTGGEGSAQDSSPDDRFVSGGLRTANRDHFAVCLDTYNLSSSAVAEALPNVVDAVTEAATDPEWISSVGTAPPTVDLGCPAPPAPLVGDVKTSSTGRILIAGDTNVTEASLFKLFLFIVPEDTIAQTFSGAPPVAAQETLKRNLDQVEIVTFAIFVSIEEASSIEYLRHTMLVGAEAQSETVFYEIRATPAVTEVPSSSTPSASLPATDD